MLTPIREGDRVRISIPDETDPEHPQYHGERGTVVAVLTDDAGKVTGDERDSALFRVQLDTDETTDFRWRDLRPPPERLSTMRLRGQSPDVVMQVSNFSVVPVIWRTTERT